jgi:alkanesulfonate monooxygenase SsuD/methylene tetrahydromethanopterin reductase-like flavin-dependent oxidoreductase (luciferase family)
VPSLSWATPDLVPDMQRRIDEAAVAAGREPSEIRRLLNVNGLLTDGAVGELVKGPRDHWVETLSGFATELGFDTFVFWPAESPLEQLERFGREVVPMLRER